MKASAYDLRIFAAIVDLGSLSAASRTMKLPKSTLSRNLAGLEERFGARLIERTTRRLRLTEAGEVLMAHARRVGEELENAESALEELRETPRGSLVVSAPYSFALHVLAPRLDSFRKVCPEVTLSILPGAQPVDFVADGIDLAIRVGELGPSSLVARRLAEIALVLVASPEFLARRGTPAAPRDLARLPLIELKSRAQPTQWRLFGPGGETSIDVTPAIATPEPAIALELAERGQGIATAPLLYASERMRSGALVRVLPDYHRGLRPVHAVYPSRRLLSPKMRAFIEFASECVRASPDSRLISAI